LGRPVITGNKPALCSAVEAVNLPPGHLRDGREVRLPGAFMLYF